jgi:hypothetical protein
MLLLQCTRMCRLPYTSCAKTVGCRQSIGETVVLLATLTVQLAGSWYPLLLVMLLRDEARLLH